jgi:hypothetical protein
MARMWVRNPIRTEDRILKTEQRHERELRRRTDPREQLTGILLTQRMMDSPQPPRAFVDFWTLAYQAIDD